MNPNKRKTVRSTAAQLRVLVDFMSANPLFAAGEFTGPLGAQKNEAQWSALAQNLENYGPKKSVEQWKHTWRDLKKRAREEAGQVRRAGSKTGNNVSVPILSESTKKILDSIGHESATGIEKEEETGLGGDMDPFIPPPPDFEEEVLVVSDEVPIQQEPESRSPPSAPANLAKSVAGPSRARPNLPASMAGPSRARPDLPASMAGPSNSNIQQRHAPRTRNAQTRPTRPSQTSNAKAFVKAQQEMNDVLKEIRNQMQEMNNHWENMLQLLQLIADNLARSGSQNI